MPSPQYTQAPVATIRSPNSSHSASSAPGSDMGSESLNQRLPANRYLRRASTLQIDGSCLTQHALLGVRAMDALSVVTEFGDAWAAHNLDAALTFITDDCVFDATGPAPDGARHVGREAIRAAWQEIFADTSSTFEPEDTFVCGVRVVQLWR